MKNKNKKLLIFSVMVLTLILIFVYSASAVFIAGDEYSIIKTFDQTITTNYSINYQYIIYSTGNFNFHTNYNDYKDNFIKLIFNVLSVDVLTDIYNNQTYQQLRDDWLNGMYWFKDSGIVGPIIQRGYIKEFITNINELIQYHKNLYNDKLNAMVSPNYVLQSIIRYNNNFKMIFLQNLEGLLNDLANNALIPTADYENLVFTSILSLSSDDFIDPLDEDIYNGYGLYTDKTIDIKLVYPIQTHFSFEGCLKYIQNPRTWQFIPTQIISIVLQFIIFIVSIGLMFKLFKTLRG